MSFMKSPMVVLDSQYGKIRVSANGDGRLMADIGDADGHAHVNDNRPALVYRGEEYIGSAWFQYTDGVVSVADFSSAVSISRRATWSAAPRTYAAAMVEAMRTAIVAYLAATPAFIHEGNYAYLNNEADSAAEKRDKAARELATATRELEAAQAALTEAAGMLAAATGEVSA